MWDPTDEPLKTKCDRCEYLEYTSELRPVQVKFDTLLICPECMDEYYSEDDEIEND